MTPLRNRPAPWRPRLCFIGYRQLSRLALSIVDDYASQAEIEFVDEVFDAALDRALTLERNGAVDAFVTAGANAGILKGSVASPVATIKVSGYDLLLALMKAKALSSRVGVVAYKETIHELDAIKAVLNIEITQKAYQTLDEARACFRELAEEGHRVIIGSSVVVELAAQEGLQGILSYSPDSIRQGIEDAIELARVARLEAQRNEQLHGVIDHLREAVLAVDEHHRLVALNPAMEELLGRSRHSLIGRNLDDVNRELSLTDTLDGGRAERGSVMTFSRRRWIADRTPIRERGQVRGAVLSLRDASDISAADTTLRSQSRGRQTLRSRYSFRDLLGESAAFLQAKDTALRFAKTDLTVLVSGESGTGKELFAQAMHAASARADRPFVAVNCSAFPDTLLESELFGHERGAFTGARRGGRAGLFESAHTGTLFLDEIGDMPLPLQTRLLRVLQEREVVRLGGSSPLPVDVRVIAATHQPLQELVQAGKFRADLYYRINILILPLPSLRERPEDITMLARHHLDRCMARLGLAGPSPQLLQMLQPRLQAHGWPGNVRELENLCERLAIFCPDLRHGETVSLQALHRHCPELFPQATAAATSCNEAAAGIVSPSAAPPGDERTRILQALERCNGNRLGAAGALGISRATLWRRMRRLDIGQ